ncbi:uncharacterized protein TRAVEDRAFT_51894 [Trametes versicolor FP-101664 SS1]|uniref:uncharacterized protein n=1 Tax=Trametes versicolor (strain FP-101664) TaxID=717944 RepID=UPI0004624744|nr:uncharacterized protein TRAVEDRAFT_51894 [Trametes versicolor FP-101664 SS1]EIW54171.1 hypothetical protein TRAVEDRAFT_51894 [Trametes versicolor FP-101664 SS1]
MACLKTALGWFDEALTTCRTSRLSIQIPKMLFFPLPSSYAVVEIDVEKTLQPLNDPVASAAGAQIKTTKCIVYLDMVLRLPLPHDTHFKYMACLIGPGLRPAYPELCITPDMCIPILPNTRHPTADREALRSDPPFPFGNCYHWSGPDMRLDIRVANDGRNYGVGPRMTLPAVQHVKMVGIQDRDMWQSCCARKERDGMARVTGVPAQAGERDSHPPLVESMRSCTIRQAQSPRSAAGAEGKGYVEANEYAELEACHYPCESCGGACHADDDSENSDEHSSRSSMDTASDGSGDCDCSDCTESLDDMGIFGLNGDPQDYLLPIVKVSLDIGAHFKDDSDVPDPMKFMQQRDALVRIIEESKLRAKQSLEATESNVAA